MYEIIRTFSPIFRILDCENPRAAAVYYVSLIINFPTNLQSILNEAQTIYKNEINRQSLQNGREELLEKGLIAKTYFTEDADVDFDREPFLPVNPEIVWEENLDRLKAYWRQPEEMAFRNEKIKDLYKYYLKNFKKYGFGTEKGSITTLYNGVWITYALLNNIKYNKRLDMMLGALGSFDLPHIGYYKRMLTQGMTVRVLYDPNSNDQMLKAVRMLYDANPADQMIKSEKLKYKEQKVITDQRLKNIKKLQEDYPARIRVRCTPVAHATSRRIICYNDKEPYLAIDARKVLSLDSRESSYYIGTIYLQRELIKFIEENFITAWEHSIDSDMKQ